MLENEANMRQIALDAQLQEEQTKRFQVHLDRQLAESKHDRARQQELRAQLAQLDAQRDKMRLEQETKMNEQLALQKKISDEVLIGMKADQEKSMEESRNRTMTEWEKQKEEMKRMMDASANRVNKQFEDKFGKSSTEGTAVRKVPNTEAPLPAAVSEDPMEEMRRENEELKRRLAASQNRGAFDNGAWLMDMVNKQENELRSRHEIPSLSGFQYAGQVGANFGNAVGLLN